MENAIMQMSVDMLLMENRRQEQSKIQMGA